MKKFMFLLVCLALIALPSSAKQTFLPFPKACDDYWRKQIPRSMRMDYIRLGRSYMDKPWVAIPDSIFAQFKQNGNRTGYEAMSFGVRRQFSCLVMAEIMEHKGRFLPAICQGLHYFIEKEAWWGIPAHYPKAKPERGIQPVDLFNAETSGMLAWTLYMLDTDIERAEKGLCDSVKDEIERRFLYPTLYNKQGWKHNVNNWNTWITANWMQTMLICERDKARRDEAIKGIKQCLLTFIKGYPDDGGCEEGVSYWDCAGASLFESLYFMQFIPKESALNLNDMQMQKVRAMGQFITTMYIDDLTFVNFSDAQARNTPNINILFPYGSFLNDEAMMRLAAYIGKKYDYFKRPTTLFSQSGNYPKLGRELMFLSMLPQFESTKAEQPKTEEAFLQNSQIMVSRSNDWFVAIKGGHNAESHNHNDVGNFILYHRNKPVIIDLGRDTYTALSFSKRRFELMNCRSSYHNVPLINGLEQRDGKAFRALNVEHISGNLGDGIVASCCMDIEKAYPKEANVSKWTRTMTLNGAAETVQLTDSFALANQQKPVEIIMMTYGEPCLDNEGMVLLGNKSVRLALPLDRVSVSWEKVEMPDGIMKEQWNDNVYRIIVTLKDGYCNGKVTLRFSNMGA